MVSNKINPVPDEVCRTCSQLWEDGCCAYQMPHSQEELDARLDPSREHMACKGLSSVIEIVERFDASQNHSS